MSVTIYIRNNCRFCDRALALLREKNVAIELINATDDEALRVQMIEKSGGRTFPQIFINHEPIGGCDALYALEAAGRLDALLQGEGQQGEKL